MAALSLFLTSFLVNVRPAAAIVGGAFSAHLAGQVNIWEKGKPKCTGSLIGVRWVLTAGHCIALEAIEYSVFMGDREIGEGIRRSVREYHYLAQYDVALLELDSDAPADLVVHYNNPSTAPPQGSVISIRGWGDDGNGMSPHLKVASMRLTTRTANPESSRTAPNGRAYQFDSIGNGYPASGDSGAGYTVNATGGHVVVAVHSGHSRNTVGRSYAVGMEYVANWIQAVTGVPGVNLNAVGDGGPAMRIQAIGDSITVGVGSSHQGGYRLPLKKRLDADKRKSDFVGSFQSGNFEDAQHEGLSGDVIAGIDEREDSTARYRPNVVLIHAGTNDIDRNLDIAGAPARLGHLIDDVFAHTPDAVVMVATLVPINDAAKQARVVAFNQAIEGLVRQKLNDEKKIMIVSMNRLSQGDDDFADGLHPNDKGYAEMADAWYEGIRDAESSGWIKETGDGGAPGQGGCSDAPNRWEDRGQIAKGIGATSNNIEFADIDGDGADDYLVVDRDTGAVDAWLNRGADRNGVPGWEERGQIAKGVGGAGWPIFADADGDGADDYLVLNDETGALRAWLNRGGDRNGVPGWEERGQIAKGGVAGNNESILLANVDCDPKVDYLVVKPNGAVNAWLNRGGDRNGVAGWQVRGQIASGTGGGNLDALADIDGDGRDDYLLLGSSGSVKAFLNRGGDPA